MQKYELTAEANNIVSDNISALATTLKDHILQICTIEKQTAEAQAEAEALRLKIVQSNQAWTAAELELANVTLQLARLGIQTGVTQAPSVTDSNVQEALFIHDSQADLYDFPLSDPGSQGFQFSPVLENEQFLLEPCLPAKDFGKPSQRSFTQVKHGCNPCLMTFTQLHIPRNIQKRKAPTGTSPRDLDLSPAKPSSAKRPHLSTPTKRRGEQKGTGEHRGNWESHSLPVPSPSSRPQLLFPAPGGRDHLRSPALWAHGRPLLPDASYSHRQVNEKSSNSPLFASSSSHAPSTFVPASSVPSAFNSLFKGPSHSSVFNTSPPAHKSPSSSSFGAARQTSVQCPFSADMPPPKTSSSDEPAHKQQSSSSFGVARKISAQPPISAGVLPPKTSLSSGAPAPKPQSSSSGAVPPRPLFSPAVTTTKPRSSFSSFTPTNKPLSSAHHPIGPSQPPSTAEDNRSPPASALSRGLTSEPTFRVPQTRPAPAFCAPSAAPHAPSAGGSHHRCTSAPSLEVAVQNQQSHDTGKPMSLPGRQTSGIQSSRQTQKKKEVQVSGASLLAKLRK
ncbi:hypothetical protein DFH06DRAFT_1313288 [Mycena polygramma]|nr:hypothetical protein DFH06DRAFT_1313288 [Mycena polygramma]